MFKAKKNFHSRYITQDSFDASNAKAVLMSVLEELSAPAITTEFGSSNPNKSQASVAQAQETLKQQSVNPAAPVQQTSPQALQGVMSQDDFDALPDAQAGTVVVKQGADGKYYLYTADPTKISYINPTPSAGTKPPVQTVAQVSEAIYDFLHNSILEDSDVIAPIETMDEPTTSIPTVKIEVSVKTETEDDSEDDESEEEEEKPKKTKKKEEDDEEEDDADYDPLANLPPLDLSDDIQKAVADAQQDMMPNIRVMPTAQQQAQIMRDGPIGAVRPIGKPTAIKSIEEDPYGLSVVGMDNDLALRMM